MAVKYGGIQCERQFGRRFWQSLAVVSGLVYANSQKQALKPEQAAASYVCPITGEELTCPKCCPLMGASRSLWDVELGGVCSSGEVLYRSPVRFKEPFAPTELGHR